MEDAECRNYSSRRVIIMKQNTNDDKAVADLPAQKDRADGDGKDVQVDEGNRNDEVVCVRDRAKGSQDQCEWHPGRSI